MNLKPNYLIWVGIQLKIFKIIDLFEGIDNDFGFYFVHSFYFECESEDNILTTSNYGTDFTSAIYSDHIIGTQFHPEKSHGNGVLLFKNFAEL